MIIKLKAKTATQARREAQQYAPCRLLGYNDVGPEACYITFVHTKDNKSPVATAVRNREPAPTRFEVRITDLLPPTLILALEMYDAALKEIISDYPNASKVYKKESFAVGAGDMARQFVKDATFTVKREYAKRMDTIYAKYFGKG